MMPLECEFESEVLAAVIQGRWPGRADAQLRAHVSSCAICSDVAAVAGAIDGAGEELRRAATVPNSGRVWWLAQIRARREAADAAGRPITVAQLVAFACAAGLMGACVGATSTWFQSALGWVKASLVPSTAALLAQHGVLAVGVGAALLLIPTAVYLAIGRD